MPWGEEYTGATLVDTYLAELAAHAWDLARATGQLDKLDPSLALPALEGARAMMVGSPVSSRGTMPVSIAVHKSLVYIANASGTPNFTGFKINPAGALAPLAGSTVSLPSGSLPGDVLFNGTGAVLAGTLADRHVHRQVGRPADARARLAVPGPGHRPFR